MNTLWDLVRSFIVSPLQRSERSSPIASRSSPRRRPAMAKRAPRKRKSGLISNDALSVSPMHAAQERPSTTLPAGPMQDRYDAMVRMMLDRYGVRVRKWRSSMSGVAWELAYADGRRVKLLESPKPKGPMSAAIFLHEIGHHAIGLGVYRPRCLEEYHAWAFAIRTMEELDLNISDGVRHRMHASLHYAVAKASRRGLKDLPNELASFRTPPPRRRRSAGGS